MLFRYLMRNIALLKESRGAKVQGCWFGLDPSHASWAPGSDGDQKNAIVRTSMLSRLGASFGVEGSPPPTRVASG